MFKALAMGWTGLAVFFAAFEQFAKMLLSIFTAGAEMAGQFEDEQRIERINKRKAMEALEAAATPAITAPVTTKVK